MTIINKYFQDIFFNKKKDQITEKLITGIEYHGFYSSWNDAENESTGYQTKNIFEKVKKAALKIKSGKAVFERDSVLFRRKIYNWPLLAILEKIALEQKGIIDLVDFGGSLGSTYFQHCDFLKPLMRLSWNIVEQKHFVDFAKAKITEKHLNFFYNIKDYLQNNKPNVFFASGVLGYLEDPFKFLNQIIKYKFNHIIIDRTAFIDLPDHKIVIQNVPSSIYEASYPMWVFNLKKFMELFTKRYNLLIDFPSYCHTDYKINSKIISWKGLYFIRK